MANLTLGLDVGCTSIGWALVDEEGERIVAVGVRVFPEGVDRDQQGGEKSKSQSRRDARGMRRQLARRARRRRQLRDALVSVGLLPNDPDDLKCVMASCGEKKRKRCERARITGKCLASDAYEVRRKAITSRLEPHEFGRALFHLAQRRGYLSNRKTDKPKAGDQKGMLAEIGGLAATLAESGDTLGKHFADLRQRPEFARTAECGRIRNRHTRRDMYEAEFEAIWEAQRKHYPDLLTDVLRYGRREKKESFPKKPDRLPKGKDFLSEYGVHGLIFFQRKMYWPKSVVGRCELERREKRCPRAARIAQRFRILQEINNLRVLDYATRDERRLTDKERATLVEYLSLSKEHSFDEIRKKLELPDTASFNLQRGGRKKLQGHQTDAALAGKNGVGKRWKELPDDNKDAVVDILIHETQEDVALRGLMECGLTQDEAERASAVRLADGYMNFSEAAIKRLLPHLERGLFVMGNDETDSAIHAAGYLRPDQRVVNQRRFLPGAPDLANPIVRQAVIEIRKVVNAILREFVYKDGHTLATIRVELIREAKKSFDERKELRFENARRRDDRETARDAIEEINRETGAQIKGTRPDVNRWLLWKEQGEECPYCGRKISPQQLFSGDTDVDHILPRWRSLDDSMANKVLCHRACNRDKGDRTPREWLEESDPDRYERVLKVAANLPGGKLRKFCQKDIQLDDFVARQLTDTAYITRCVSQYLQCLGAEVACTRGDMTSDLCHWWGLNNILDPTKKNRKMREDHRQHAVDAIAVALTNKKRLHTLANARGKNMPFPWHGFHEAAEQHITAINVSHRALRGLRGAFHEETIYGCTQKRRDAPPPDAALPRPWAKDWVEGRNVFVRRKPVTDVTDGKHLAKIRDDTIRRILEQHLRHHGVVDPSTAGKLPKGIFEGDKTPRMPSGVPIRRVRMLEESQTVRRVSQRRSYQYVRLGSNHHIVYRAVTKRGKEVWEAEVLPMFDAADRAKSRIPLIDRSAADKARFLFSLSIGETFQIDDGGGGRRLCVVQKMRQDDKRVNYRLHTDARPADQIQRENLTLSPTKMQGLHARKVAVDAIGRIRFAND